MPGAASRPQSPPERAGRVDVVLRGLVVLVAVAAGSFVARNSDLWLHLAAGRLLAAGEYHFDADPFASTTAGRYWANHAWLWDLGAYLVFEKLGAAAVVAIKAAAVGGTAGAMLWAARGRGPVWLAAGCVTLAVLAMVPRLLLQPAVASYLLLAVCLGCLTAGGAALRALSVLVALWVNLDGWFVLGPALVGLFWVGRRIDPDRERLPAWPSWLVPATLAACLVSPHHVRGLTLPPELSPAVWASGFPSDPRFAGFFASPWHLAPLGAAGGYSLAAWAFVLLLGLGVVSFAVNPRAARGWRGVVWLAFAGLACWQARLVPFFAVAAGPITARNLGDVLPAGDGAARGRGAVLLAGAALAALGWYGKLTGFHHHDRGAAWGIHADPTLAHTAAAVAEWPLPPDAAVFTSHPDVGHYLAWFAPGRRASLDSRLDLFTDVAGEYRELSAAVGLLPGEGNRGTEPFAARGISGVVVYDPDPRRMTDAIRAVAGGPWAVVRVPGGAVLAGPTGGPRFGPGRAAFGTGGELPAAEAGPAVLAESEPWWVVSRETGRRGSWEADAGAVYLRLFEHAADRSPALPLLALRAGRRGAELDPADPTAWLVAGRALLVLDTRTAERDLGDTLSPLAFVRHVGTTAALVQAARLAPDSAAAHEGLAAVFGRRGFLDLAHRHAAEARRLVAQGGPGAGESAGAFADRLARITDAADAAERQLQDAENRFLVRTTGQAGDSLGRAQVAAELGLPQRAVDVLLASHPDLYGVSGLGLLADLLLQTGQAGAARALLDRDELRRNPAALGLFTLPGRTAPNGPAWAYRLPAYDWYDLNQCVAAGNYPGAAAAADRIRAHLDAEERQFGPPTRVALAAIATRASGFAAAARTGGLGGLGGVAFTLREGQRVSSFLAQTRFLSVARADLGVLVGVLELERGNPAGAAARFRDALALYAVARGTAPSLPGEPLAKWYLERIDLHR